MKELQITTHPFTGLHISLHSRHAWQQSVVWWSV